MRRDDFHNVTVQVMRHTIDQLQTLLNEAQGYFITGNEGAAWGTLVLFDEAAEDLKAALRLYRILNARRMS